jgi:hypothetical protein
MRFFISIHEATGEGHTVCILITNQVFENATTLRTALKEEFGPWMLIGVREYDKQQFLQLFEQSLPPKVVQALDTAPFNFLYKAAFHTNYS